MRYAINVARHVAALALAAITLTTSVSAQARPGGGMPGMPRFDPATVVTLKGTIDKVERLAGQQKGVTGIHLVLKTADGRTTSIHLGPTFWVDSQAVKLAQGDRIAVTGSKVTYYGAPIVLAKSVEKEGKTLALRDSAGMPLWRGMGMGMRKP